MGINSTGREQRHHRGFFPLLRRSFLGGEYSSYCGTFFFEGTLEAINEDLIGCLHVLPLQKPDEN